MNARYLKIVGIALIASASATTMGAVDPFTLKVIPAHTTPAVGGSLRDSGEKIIKSGIVTIQTQISALLRTSTSAINIILASQANIHGKSVHVAGTGGNTFGAAAPVSIASEGPAPTPGTANSGATNSNPVTGSDASTIHLSTTGEPIATGGQTNLSSSLPGGIIIPSPVVPVIPAGPVTPPVTTPGTTESPTPPAPVTPVTVIPSPLPPLFPTAPAVAPPVVVAPPTIPTVPTGGTLTTVTPAAPVVSPPDTTPISLSPAGLTQPPIRVPIRTPLRSPSSP